MTENELSTDPVAVLQRVGVEIAAARKTVKMLYEQWAMTSGNAKEMARNELCKALVELFCWPREKPVIQTARPAIPACFMLH